jgi:hypothetical protein
LEGHEQLGLSPENVPAVAAELFATGGARFSFESYDGLKDPFSIVGRYGLERFTGAFLDDDLGAQTDFGLAYRESTTSKASISSSLALAAS